MIAIWERLLEAAKKPKSPLGIPPNLALLEATDTAFRKVDQVTARAPHARDGTDIKRLMLTVVFAMVPCLLFGMYNTGRVAYLSIGVKDASILQCFLEGAVWMVPIIAIVYLVGGFWEGLFAQLRGHEVAEGFLVTGMLIVLIVPATIPWWQLVLGTSFGVVIGKEVFGGAGMNILNPALTARAFLFFAYPAQLSGDVWAASPVRKVVEGGVTKLVPHWQTTISLDKIQAFISGSAQAVDGYSGATALALAATNEPGVDSVALLHKTYSVADMFWGFIPGSIGETSVACVALGALILIVTGVGSWRTMLSVFAGGFAMASVLYFVAQGDHSAAGSYQPPTFFGLKPWEHLILGSFAFGAVFMATDPVSSPFHKNSKIIYGFLIGVLCVIIRTINPAYPEGMMLAILFMNVFAPLIDHYVVGAALKRRQAVRSGNAG